jgi:hypothetical protein
LNFGKVERFTGLWHTRFVADSLTKSRMAEGESKLPWWKRQTLPAIIILAILLATFLFLFWMIGHAAYNQSVPR